MLSGRVPYEGWDVDKITDAILKGIRPYKPKAAAHLGLVDELWDILGRCWDERREARPDLQAVRTRLDEVAPMWHARKHFQLTPADDVVSVYSHYSRSSPTPSRTPAPPSPPPESST